MQESTHTPPVVDEPIVPTPKKTVLWRRILKWCGIAVGSLLLLILLVLSIALCYLSPSRLTPIVNDYLSSYLNADARAERIELTFWSTFPHLKLQVDNLDIVSHSLDSVDSNAASLLPADADSLFSISCFKGGVNIASLLSGNIDLYDVELSSPRLNLVVINDSVNNFNILPPSEPDTAPADESSALPPVSINRFELKGNFPVRYRMPADSTDILLTLSESSLIGEDAPLYTLDIAGRTGKGLFIKALPELPFSINGNINWDQTNPEMIALDKFSFRALDMGADLSTKVQVGDTILVHELDMHLLRVDLGRIIPLIPEQYAGRLKDIDTDLGLQMDVHLLKPYAPTSMGIPDMEMEVYADASKLLFDAMHLTKIDAAVKAVVDGADLDRSVIDVERFVVVGKAMDFKLDGTVHHPISDPLINGHFSGNITFQRISRKLLAKLPFSLSGRLHGDAGVKTRMSWLNPKKFHRMKIDGNLSLQNFAMDMRDSTMSAFVRRCDFHLGSNSLRSIGEKSIDSLLTASLKVDTMAVHLPGMRMAGRELNIGVGTRNVASSTDSSSINPIGGNVRAGLLTMEADSNNVRLRLVNASVGGALQRFNNDSRAPRLDLRVSADRIRYRTDGMRASMRSGQASLTLHPRVRRPMSPRMQARVDSLAAIYPHLTSDSLRSLARLSMRSYSRRQNVDDGRENIDFALDNSVSSWLRTWQLKGSFTAKRANLYTPYFPTRNRLRNIDLTFSTDSVIISDTRFTSGKSDFVINGSIRNISRALTSRRHTPLSIDFDLQSDTIDVNDFTATMLRGAAYSDDRAAQLVADLSDDTYSDSDEADEFVASDTAAIAAFVVPSNIRGSFNMNARHVHYGNIWLNDMGGTIRMWDGAISLDKLHASTDIGSIDFSALYSAPTKHNLSVAADINIQKLNLRKFLSELPALDSIMPMLNSVDGMVDAQLAFTSRLDTVMNLDLGSLDMALNLSGDSLVLLDSDTFRTLAKWLMFKNKNRNMIDHMDVEMMVHNGYLDLYPVIFDMDRYRLGVMGGNDMNFNLDYHLSVLKSPLPFKFGINVKGTPEKMKIRLGKSRLNEKTVAKTRHITDSARVNLVSEMRRVFNRGVRTAGSYGLRMQQQRSVSPNSTKVNIADDTISSADSLLFIREGLIEAPTPPQADDKSSKK